ncbi:MAG: hypothetical protein P8J33_16055 [Pirellulaceae bacterium]|nr:hypothetical protein [Pirellulaceae bacterium]
MLLRTLFCGWLVLWLAHSVDAQPRNDWLIDGAPYTAKYESVAGHTNRFSLSNGLVSRTFLLDQDVGATIGLEALSTDQNIFRAVKPEAQVTIDGVLYDVGGLADQPNYAYLRDEWLAQMAPSEKALAFVKAEVSEPLERFAWSRKRHHAPHAKWPPDGIHLTLEFQPPPELKVENDFRVFVHYELYDGVPVFCKWLTVENRSTQTLTVDHFASEILAIVEHDSRVESRAGVALPKPQTLHVETDFAFGGFTSENANRHVVHWKVDPEYSTQVNYRRESPCLLVVEPTYGPAQKIAAGQSFQSCRAFELVYDSTERERRSLALRRMYRIIAPWITENPIMHHLTVSDPATVERAIKQAAEVGFEMVILSFGSGFNIEDGSRENLRRWQAIAELAEQSGVEIGGYSLLSSRRIGGGNDIVSPPGQTPTHGHCPALTSPWGQAYYKALREFYQATGFDLLEHDGPYPGDVDVTERLPLQAGEADSRWVQGQIANEFYRWCRAQGIYVNAPDYYFLNGTNKCGMGYREVNWSLPREMQLIHTRQNIFDGTWYKTPSMGWMFVPLTEYHGGGAAATIEPLDEHLKHYRQMMESNFAFGVQACYRGPRLFDTERTRNLVADTVAWFKTHRDILESDVIHGRRPDGRELDWMLHVNPQLETQGMLLVYNPTDRKMVRDLRVNLYYTGLRGECGMASQSQEESTLSIAEDHVAVVPVEVPPQGMQWIRFFER